MRDMVADLLRANPGGVHVNDLASALCPYMDREQVYDALVSLFRALLITTRPGGPVYWIGQHGSHLVH
jgi:hypothetical protein